jgi:TRAP-type C4-dicarboxylate transport system permease small subunit
MGLMVLLIPAQVFCRHAPGNALPWPEEASRFLMLRSTGLMARTAFRRGGFVAIDMALRALPRQVATGISLGLVPLVLWVALGIGWSEVTGLGGRFETDSLWLPVSPDLATGMKVPKAWMMASLLVGVALLFLVAVERILRNIHKRHRFKRTGEGHQGRGRRGVEGTANGITDIMSMKFTDAGIRYLTLDGHSDMGAFWWMGNDRFKSLTPEPQQIVVDGFAALQQATFASPKRKEIQAHADFRAAGGEIYVLTADEKAAFKAAVAPVFDWFKANMKGGPEVLDAFTAAVAEAEAAVAADRAAELN